ncbi:unnamed protein product, partial [marine sediment metagenome]
KSLKPTLTLSPSTFAIYILCDNRAPQAYYNLLL